MAGVRSVKTAVLTANPAWAMIADPARSVVSEVNAAARRRCGTALTVVGRLEMGLMGRGPMVGVTNAAGLMMRRALAPSVVNAAADRPPCVKGPKARRASSGARAVPVR